MQTRVKEAYDDAVVALSRDERLQLASMLLQDLSRPDLRLVEARDHWTDQDQADLTSFVLAHGAASYPESEDLV